MGARKQSKVNVEYKTRYRVTTKNELLHLVIDSTGLKILGNGEWDAFKHRVSNKRRNWRKLHIAVRDGGLIVGSAIRRKPRRRRQHRCRPAQ